MSHRIRDLIHQRLRARLDEHRTVVWYDPSRALRPVFDSFSAQGVELIDGTGSPVRARQRTDLAWMKLWQGDGAAALKGVVVYLPYARPTREEDRFRDTFEAIARLGATFGDRPEDELAALARLALPACVEKIDELFGAGSPPALDVLEALADGATFTLLKSVLNSDDPYVWCVEILSRPEAESKLLDPNVRAEALDLLARRVGFVAPSGQTLPHALAQWLLFSEFCFDAGSEALPEPVAHVPRAGVSFRETILKIAGDLRRNLDLQELYLRIATDVERDLHLTRLADTSQPWGVRDTFPSEDIAAFRYVVQCVLAGRREEATAAARERETHSFWRKQPDRHGRWNLLFRVLELLEAANAWRPFAPATTANVLAHVDAYVDEKRGLWRVDRAHRWVERSIAELLDRDHVGPLIELARREWWTAIDESQARFFAAVRREGWPSPGLSQRDVFDQFVRPVAQTKERAALFLVDGCTYEMGHDLRRHLESIGEVELNAARGVVPSTTEFGMAALLPGAASGLRLVVVDGELLPSLEGNVLPHAAARADAWRRALGDRVTILDLDDLFGTVEQVKGRVGKAPLLVVRCPDPDRLAENGASPIVWRALSQVLEDLARAAAALARAGVTRMFFTADHGHVLLPEPLPGEAVSAPRGEWVLEKRRLRVGTIQGSRDGCAELSAERLGWPGSDLGVLAASGFRTFQRNTTYFHEGLSLQELLVPVVSLRAKRLTRTTLTETVDIVSKRDAFIQRIFQVRLVPQGLFSKGSRVRVRVVDPATGRDVGRVADCEALDPETGLVHLDKTEAILIQVSDDHGGDVELRVLDPSGSGAELGRRVMKNGCLQ